ncbi:MAG TPA: hypothetical protein VK735_47720 [Pseudonocardia sp.]|uniref:hypothetical protein n=1 Tax=Pseudonocardia sp. TaxID=60912 RepID=UPI002CD813AD|nr:hypothetical protein [Pseudonocardia sp.]HTF55183.1 hypothetical protein [Pseudonocardia sp.]
MTAPPARRGGRRCGTYRRRRPGRATDRPARAAAIVGGSTVAGQLLLRTPRWDTGHFSFDPMKHRPPGLRLYPEWLTELRELAYRGSRRGRGAPEEPGNDAQNSRRCS